MPQTEGTIPFPTVAIKTIAEILREKAIFSRRHELAIAVLNVSEWHENAENVYDMALDTIKGTIEDRIEKVVASLENATAESVIPWKAIIGFLLVVVCKTSCDKA